MRCFVAIELPEEVKERLAELQAELGAPGGGVRWMKPEAMHLTVKFLGEVPDKHLPAVCDAVSMAADWCRPFELAVRSAGCFPARGGVRVVWAGVEEPTGVLADLHATCQEVMFELGFPVEGRAFSPHLTLGRSKDPRRAAPLRDLLPSVEGFDAGVVDVDELILFESRLKKEGAEHTPMHRAKLGGQPR